MAVTYWPLLPMDANHYREEVVIAKYVALLVFGSLLVVGIVVEVRTHHHVDNFAFSDAAWQRQP